MRALGFAVGIAAAVGGWYWLQTPQLPAPAEVAAEAVREQEPGFPVSSDPAGDRSVDSRGDTGADAAGNTPGGSGVAADVGAEAESGGDIGSNFGGDVGDFGTSTYRVPPPADWIVKPGPGALAPVEPQWLVITQPFSSETAAQAFSEAVAADTGLSVAVQNPAFREYQVAVRLDATLSRQQAVGALNGQYSWMRFE